jgi:penicillin-binding protein 1A
MNYGKKSTQKREKELISKSTMIRKKFYVIFCKSLLICVFAFMVIGVCSGVGIIRGTLILLVRGIWKGQRKCIK